MLPRTLFLVVAGASLGIAAGAGAYTFVYARGWSYLTDDPRACANCHIMREQYDGWIASTHRAAAVCNDCHTPAGLVPKYAVKAKNGFWHSFYFTTESFHEPIAITEGSRAIAEEACRKCHSNIVDSMHVASGEGASCLRCHPSVGHLD